MSSLKHNCSVPSAHLDRKVAHPGKIWPVAMVAGREACVWTMPVFSGLGFLGPSLFVLVFLSPEGLSNFPASPQPRSSTSQRLSRSLAVSAFLPRLGQISLRGTHGKAGLRRGTSFLLVWGSGCVSPSWAGGMCGADVLAAGTRRGWQGVGQWLLLSELPPEKFAGRLQARAPDTPSPEAGPAGAGVGV